MKEFNPVTLYALCYKVHEGVSHVFSYKMKTQIRTLNCSPTGADKRNCLINTTEFFIEQPNTAYWFAFLTLQSLNLTSLRNSFSNM